VDQDSRRRGQHPAGLRDCIRRYIRPALGNVPVGKITAKMLESFYAELRRCRVRCKPLSSTTIRHVHTAISSTLAAAANCWPCAWPDVDFEAAKLDIRRSYVWTAGRGVEKDTKTPTRCAASPRTRPPSKSSRPTA